jgi:hypothetical protein
MYIKQGGGKIKRKLLLSVLFICGFALVLNMNFSSAATVNQINNTVNSVSTPNTENHTVTSTIKATANTTVKAAVANTTIKTTTTPTTAKTVTNTTAKTTTAKAAAATPPLVDGLTVAQVKDGLTRAQNFVVANGRLPNYVSYGSKHIPIAQFQAILKAEGLKMTGNANRPIYITSDNINNSAKDNARINSIISGLRSLGLAAYNMGLGPNKHDTVLTSGKLPCNAVVVDLYGGADSGLIKEMGSAWYKGLKGARTVFSVFWPPSADISGLAFLPRAHDDNYDPASFTGLAHPAHYLLENGYNYIHSGSILSIINAIFYQAKI